MSTSCQCFTMPFKKDDPQTKEWAKRAVEAKAEHKQSVWEFLASGGPREYQGMLEKLKTQGLAENEKEWMDRVERLFPFVKSKPTQSHDLTSGGKVISGFQIIDATINPSTHGEPIPDTAGPPSGAETEN